MENKFKVNIFLVILCVLAILFAIFALNKRSDSASSLSVEEYDANIRVLTDTIKSLREDIAKYEEELKRIDLERESIRRELKQIVKNNEKVDSELANGGWDTNVEFLTDYLSEEDSVE